MEIDDWEEFAKMFFLFVVIAVIFMAFNDMANNEEEKEKFCENSGGYYYSIKSGVMTREYFCEISGREFRIIEDNENFKLVGGYNGLV